MLTELIHCDFCTATVAREFLDAEWGTTHDGDRLCPDCVEGGNWRECQACGFYDQRRRGDYCQACEEAWASGPDPQTAEAHACGAWGEVRS